MGTSRLSVCLRVGNGPILLFVQFVFTISIRKYNSKFKQTIANIPQDDIPGGTEICSNQLQSTLYHLNILLTKKSPQRITYKTDIIVF